ncbi:MAG TPA: CDP-glucose 4,6-dehydratase [Solirubrobacteraceae bacterium]|nr:CDP-glucose 4,6-dehydratase [Solirubrobacteraceae bacterium]
MNTTTPDPASPPVRAVDPEFWRERRVLITGHTGFKGAWLALWLQSLGARVSGFAVGVPTRPSLYEVARVEEGLQSISGDVREFDALAAALEAVRPEVVIHMAAQSLVRRSYVCPRETYEVNVMGTVNLLEAVRGRPEVRAVLNVTSDKCYANREWEWAYREDDRLGGHDPYSSSKGCAELVTGAYRDSFFAIHDGPRLASARAGNVLGGGDWSEDRLLPDLMRGALDGQSVEVRNPQSVRPWQHVLNPLGGYLQLIQALWSSERYVGGWNFGPGERDCQPVLTVVEWLTDLWPESLPWVDASGRHADQSHEAHQLRLDSARARKRLHWRPGWELRGGLQALVDWYRALQAGEDMRVVTLGQIDAFQRALTPA